MKPILKAAAYTILIAASTHIALLVLYAFTTGDFAVLNAFDILDLELFFPSIIDGQYSFALSWLLIGAIYFAMYMKVSKKKSSKE